jgi:hypothetical protein
MLSAAHPEGARLVQPETVAMIESPPSPRRFRASIGEVMGLVALVTLACAWPLFIPTEVVAVLVWVAARRESDVSR